MARKQKHEEHENLERWLVSYADFMTLLFATFVVLYALAQIDMKEFEKLEESIKAAFNNSPIAGGQAMMDGIGMNVIDQNGTSQNDSVIPPLMEYLSQKYEKNSMEEIQKALEEALDKGELEGIKAEVTDRGLVITLKDINAFFHSGSAELTPVAQKTIDKIGALIKKKFNNHIIRIEGHTDSMPVSKNSIYPSNWELSSARSSSVARFMIDKYKIKENLFTIVGYGDTKPLDTNSTPQGREKNRRVEIVVLKNQYAKYEPMGAETINPQNNIQNSIQKPKNIFRKGGLSDAAKELLKGDDIKTEDVIILDEYNKPKNNAVKDAIIEFEAGKQDNKEKLNKGFH